MEMHDSRELIKMSKQTTTLENSARAFTLIELMIVIAILGTLIAIIVPSFARARARGVLSACVSNLKNISTALEMYAVDNAHNYPVALSGVVPRYLKVLPTCPSNNVDSYSTGFLSSSNPDVFTVVCNGLYHQGVNINTAGYPQYLSGSGPVEKP